MSLPKEITKKLRGADPELSSYVRALEKENRRLQDDIGKLRSRITTKDNEIKALKKMQPEGINVIIQGPPPDQGQGKPSGPPALPEAKPYQHPQPDIPGEPIQITN